MVNGGYWIYSERNGHTILARCEGSMICFVDKVYVATLAMLYLNRNNY